mgnify:FL=1
MVSKIDMKDKKTKEVWYAHGEVSNTKSIMLGYDHYCGSLAKINDYIKGKYDYPGTKDKVPSIEQKLELWKNEKVEVLRRSLISWIDLFFFSDLHIIGLG